MATSIFAQLVDHSIAELLLALDDDLRLSDLPANTIVARLGKDLTVFLFADDSLLLFDDSESEWSRRVEICLGAGLSHQALLQMPPTSRHDRIVSALTDALVID